MSTNRKRESIFVQMSKTKIKIETNLSFRFFFNRDENAGSDRRNRDKFSLENMKLMLIDKFDFDLLNEEFTNINKKDLVSLPFNLILD